MQTQARRLDLETVQSPDHDIEIGTHSIILLLDRPEEISGAKAPAEMDLILSELDPL